MYQCGLKFRNVPRAACPTLIFAPPWPKIKRQAHPCTAGDSRCSGQSPAHTGPSGHPSCPKTYGPPLAAGGPPQLDPGQRRPVCQVAVSFAPLQRSGWRRPPLSPYRYFYYSYSLKSFFNLNTYPCIKDVMQRKGDNERETCAPVHARSLYRS